MSNSEGIKIIAFTPSWWGRERTKAELFEQLYFITYNFAK